MLQATISVSDHSQSEPIFDSSGPFGSLTPLSLQPADAQRGSDLSLASHQDVPLPDEVEREFRRIIKAAEKELS